MLPRFTSGQIGRLTFEHLNEICDTVDRLRPMLQGSKYSISSELVLARISGYGLDVEQFGDHLWKEITPAPRNQIRRAPTYTDRVGGRESGTVQDGDKYQPAFLPGISDNPINRYPTLPVNTVVVLMRVPTVDGKTFWLAINQISTTTFAAEIMANEALDVGSPVNRWYYHWREVAWSWTSRTWFHDASIHRSTIGGQTVLFMAINGCERPTPGIGGSGPGNVIANSPIESGTVVSMSQVAQNDGLEGIQYFFSVPNGLRIVC